MIWHQSDILCDDCWIRDVIVKNVVRIGRICPVGTLLLKGILWLHVVVEYNRVSFEGDGLKYFRWTVI